MTIPRPFRIAIVGGGPGGLATAIQLSRLSNIELSLFEAAKELREIGAVCLPLPVSALEQG
jgi:salicylate hydroxylase